MNRIKRIVGIIICVISLIGCANGYLGAGKASSLYNDFYVGDEGTQYFIKPLTLESSASKKEQLLVDFTFRYRDKIKDSAIVNFSLVNDKPIKRVSSFQFLLGENTLSSDAVELMFNERQRNGFISRFSFKLPLQQVKYLFDSDQEWKAQISELQETTFTLSKKSRKSIQILNSAIFVLVD